ncbi:MAG: hypothetical protein ABGX16_15715, partial [Pirellulales bacterium]
ERYFDTCHQTAKAFGVSIRSLRSAQAGLETKGFIEVVKGGGGCKKRQPTIVRLASRQKVTTI